METGQTLQGKYVIERLLGKGGMGSVWLAHQSALGKKKVAIKQMEVTVRDVRERDRVVEQFQKEARLLATLEHPSLVTVYDYFEEGDNHFLVMTYVEGQTLEEVYVEKMGELDIVTILEWMGQICDVIEYLHAHEPPIIYRDLKPSNVMVDKKGRIWLLDFGIAKVAEADSKTSTLIKGAGTLGYAPVEQFGHSSTDARSDVYSLGATLYSLVTGSQPPVSVDLMLNDARLIPPSQINPDVIPELEAVIFKMMALRKDDRYQTMRDAHNALNIATKKLRDQRERKAAREAPGALKVRFVSPDGRAVEARPFSQPAEMPPPVPGTGGLPTMMGGAGQPTFPSAPFPGSGIPGVIPGLVKPLPAAPSEEDAPRWVQYLEGADMDPTAHEQNLPWWQQPHAAWYVYVGVGIVCLLFALPTFGGLRSVGIVPGFNYLSFNIGKGLSGGASETVRHLGGLIAMFGLPALVGLFFYLREDFFPALLAAYFVAQGVGDLGLDLRWVRGANGYGAAADLYALLAYTDPAQYAKTSWTLIVIGHVLTLTVLVYMGRWLYHYRPRKRVIVIQ